MKIYLNFSSLTSSDQASASEEMFDSLAMLFVGYLVS